MNKYIAELVGTFVLMFCGIGAAVIDGMFVVASPVDADAALASARDTPAIPNADKALLRRLLFEERLDMAQFSHPFGHIGPLSRGQVTWRLFAKLG